MMETLSMGMAAIQLVPSKSTGFAKEDRQLQKIPAAVQMPVTLFNLEPIALH